MSEYVDRRAAQLIREAMADTRIVLVLGARQVGKSTLTSHVAKESFSAAQQLTLFDQVTREAALTDPTGFVAALDRPVLIDEVQRAPDLLLAITAAVDADTSPGQFLLTGSANILTTKRSYESMTGRTEIVKLFPFAMAEIEGVTGNIVDSLLAGEPPKVRGATVGRAAFVGPIAAGGYPEARQRTPSRRVPWFRDYVETILERDLRDLATAQKAQEIPRLLRLLASQSANLLDYSKIARDLSLSDKTVKAYVKLLQDVFLVHVVRPWRPNIGKREVHAPKPYIVDSGLLGYLLGVDEARIAQDDQATGKMLENFCGMEIVKHASWSQSRPEVFHYRDDRDEIDIVIEDRSGAIACVEVKAAASVSERDYRPMSKLRDRRSDQFKAGVVLYSGADTVPLSDRIWAVPISGLWMG